MDVLANKFYKAFYTLRHVHLQEKIRYQWISNKGVLLPHHVSGATANQAMLQLYPLPNRRH